MKNKKTLQNIEVLIFDEKRKTLTAEKGIDIVADQIESESGIYHLSDAQIFTDEWNGKIYYLFNAELPEKVEANKLKGLRRSNALARMFDYQVSKPMDMFKFMPWVAIILLILFGGK